MNAQNSSCGLSGHEDPHKKQDLEIRECLSHIRNKILVMSGKGGVGKSSVAAYLSVSLAKRGFKVGLMDVDLHGPSIPRMLGLRGTIGPGSKDGKASPVPYLPNLDVISIEPLMGEDRDRATIWRGPLKIGVIRQFIADIEWRDLDFLIIDSPPGTGDEPLTVAQTIPDARALIVTTPQEISLADVRKSINFCRNVNMKILGIVENMSGFKCPHCGESIELFKSDGGMLTAKKEGIAFLGSLPLDPLVVQSGDSGSMAILDDESSPFTRAFMDMAARVVREVEEDGAAGPGGSEDSREEGGEVAPEPGSRILAVPVSDGKLCSHFGHCDQFAFIMTKDGKITGSEMRTPPPHEPGVLPQWISDQGASVVICGGLGDRAKQLLVEKGIEVITGAPMDAPESLANQYLSDTLITGDNVCDH